MILETTLFWTIQRGTRGNECPFQDLHKWILLLMLLLLLFCVCYYCQSRYGLTVLQVTIVFAVDKSNFDTTRSLT